MWLIMQIAGANAAATPKLIDCTNNVVFQALDCQAADTCKVIEAKNISQCTGSPTLILPPVTAPLSTVEGV